MALSIEGSQIAAEAGADEKRGVIVEQFFHELQLTCNGKLREIAFCEVGRFQVDAMLAKVLRKEASLAGFGTGSKTVQIEDTQIGRQHL